MFEAVVRRQLRMRRTSHLERPPVCALALSLLIAVAAFAGRAQAGRIPPKGSYEYQSLQLALERFGLEIDPAPEGKVLRRIHVMNQRVFGPRDGALLQWFNVFHRTTRVDQIEREVILRPGQPWDESKVEETARKLRDPIFTTLVIVVPVKSPEPGTVDLLVVTRDVWSLRFNSSFEIQERKLIDLQLSISENNFLGWRKHIAAVFLMDQGDYFIGPYYDDPNVAGTKLELRTHVGPIFGRESHELEGSRSSTRFQYPFWSLDTPWSAGITAGHLDHVVREFVGTDLRKWDWDGTLPADQAVPWEYRHRIVEVESFIARSYGKRVINRFTLGHDLRISRPSTLPDFPGDETVREAFIDQVLPRSERTSLLFLRYNVFTPRYVAYRDITTYDLSEDQRLGPDFTVELGSALRVLGSESNHLRGTAALSWMFDYCRDGFAKVGASVTGRLEAGDLIDNRVDASAQLATPRQLDLFRLVARATISARIDETQNRFFTLGGTNGMRGFPISWFDGQISVVGNLEVRSMPLQIWFTRVGGLVFWDVGHAADHLDDLRLHHDIGIGGRMLIPQLSPLVYRLDWAIPLNGESAGLPGRLTLGLDQTF